MSDFDLKVLTRDGGDTSIEMRGLPDECPRCHCKINVKPMRGCLTDSKSRAQLMFRCTSADCDEVFIGTYMRDPGRYGSGRYELRWTSPWRAATAVFPGNVAELSPTFVEIMNQVAVAESSQLSQLVGIGLRKALEFLVKDFAIHQQPAQADAIKAAMLSNCIENHISDTNIKQCAKRAAWLGNDETHYVRKWEDKDISDLKLLVHLTVNWIDNVLLTQKYVQEMQKGA